MRLFFSELKKLLFTPVSFFIALAALAALVIIPAKDVIRYRTVNEEQLGMSVEDIVQEVNTRAAPNTRDYLNHKWSGGLSDPRLNGRVDEADLEYLYSYWTHWDHVTKLRLYRSSGMLADEVLNDPMEEKVFENVSLRKARYRVGVLEARGQTDTPEYAARKLQISMIEAAGIQKGNYVYFWDQMENQTQYFGLLFGALYVMLVSRVFATEYSSGMYMLLASTRQGKRRAAYSKLAACSVTGTLLVLALNLIPAAVYLLGGTAAGWDATVNNLSLFPYCPYNITVAEYFLLKIGNGVFIPEAALRGARGGGGAGGDAVSLRRQPDRRRPGALVHLVQPRVRPMPRGGARPVPCADSVRAAGAVSHRAGGGSGAFHSAVPGTHLPQLQPGERQHRPLIP